MVVALMVDSSVVFPIRVSLIECVIGRQHCIPSHCTSMLSTHVFLCARNTERTMNRHD
jgi:hypothetical protein